MHCTDTLYVHTYIHVSMCVYLAVPFAFLFMAREIINLLFFNRQQGAQIKQS